MTLGGERIFLRLGVSIFGCWIKFQFFGAIKICAENSIHESGKSHDGFTSVEISVELRHSKGRGGGTEERGMKRQQERVSLPTNAYSASLFCARLNFCLCHLAFGRSIASLHSLDLIGAENAENLLLGAQLGTHVGF